MLKKIFLIAIFCSIFIGICSFIFINNSDKNELVKIEPIKTLPIETQSIDLSPIEEKLIVLKPIVQKPVENWREIEKKNQEQRNKEAEAYMKQQGNTNIIIKSYQTVKINKQSIQNRIKNIDIEIEKLKQNIDITNEFIEKQIRLGRKDLMAPEYVNLGDGKGYFTASSTTKKLSEYKKNIKQLEQEKENILKQLNN